MPDINDAVASEAQNEPFVINPSRILAIAKTVGSLVTFAIMFGSAMIGFARNLDIQGAITFLQRDDIAASLAGFLSVAWLVWRSTAAYRKKLRDIIIAREAPNHIAIVASDPASPVLARETTTTVPTPTRLVDAGLVLHRQPPVQGNEP